MRLSPFIAFIILLLAFLLFTYSVKNYDTAEIGPQSSSVGYSHLNEAFRHAAEHFSGKDAIAYILSKYLFFIALATVPLYALIGLMQLLQKDVSPQIWLLAAGYASIAIAYCVFEIWIVNYRPILEADGTLEASYPSSHTFIAIALLGMSAITCHRNLKKWRTQFVVAHVAIAAIIVIGRALSGVHWLTDIIGGILLASTLLCAFASIKKWQPR